MYGKPTTRSRNPTTRKRTVKRSYGYKKRTALPTRYYGGSRKAYGKRRNFGKSLNTLGETKLRPCDNQTEESPVPIQLGAQAQFYAINVGPSGLFVGSNPVNGIQIDQGTGFNQRIGNYLYYKKTHLTMRIEMNADSSNPPIQFRMIMYKIRRSASPSGITPQFSSSGFLGTNGSSFGHASSGTTGLDLIMQPLNKRDWVIYKDIQFILQPYNDQEAGGPAILYNHYPASKQVQLNCPYYKKAHFPTGAISPDDLNFSYGVIIYAHTLGRSGFIPDSWEVTTRGTTSFCDP